MSKPRSRKRSEWNTNPTFSQWLYTKLESDGEIGMLAKWIYDDLCVDEATGKRSDEPCWPHRANTITHLVVHLRTYHGRERKAPTELLLRQAFDEYRAFLAAGGKIPARRGGIKPANVPKARLWVTRATVDKAGELANWMGLQTEARVIEKLIEDAHRKHAP